MKFPKFKGSKRLRRLLTPRPRYPIAIPLSNYPPELIERVAAFLPRKDLCNLRLVNRKVNCATVHLFVRENFRQFDIDFTQEGLQKLVDISQHYDLSGEVNFGAWIQVVRLRQAVWSDREERAWTNALTVKGYPKQRRVLKKGARTAALLWQSHLEMDAGGHYRQTLITALQGMKRLQCISVLDHLDKTDLNGNIVYIIRETRGMYPQPEQTVYVPTILESAERFAYTLETIFAAMTLSSAQLIIKHIRLEYQKIKDRGSLITLSQLAGIMDRHEALYGGPSHAWKFLESCSWLDMSFYREERNFPSLETQASLGRFMTPMASSLTKLSLRGHKARYDEALLPIVYQLAQAVHLPKLQSLYFQQASIHSTDLETFVLRHASTLESILLLEVRLDSGGCSRFLTNLSDCATPNLAKFVVHAVFESDISRQEDGSYQIGETLDISWPELKQDNADDWIISTWYSSQKLAS
ncbi:hypothetical protein BLS_008210 [Venturia inaequalis]|uniref:F-box domain-containing protein n=1 Tax=Venturia inaequalis TaxID=5025 RepID=A0A8H3U7J9_VENIN|nr:hypothetical protein BLS_008210 [Venturia inaequalis]